MANQKPGTREGNPKSMGIKKPRKYEIGPQELGIKKSRKDQSKHKKAL
jgi:hypothetical protein